MAIREDAFAALGLTLFKGIEPGGKLMIFGRPSLLWEGAPTPEEYYQRFGFAEVHTLDVSPYEGATHIFDLNNPDIPKELEGQYRVVITGGTMEHVFNVQNVMRAGARMLEVGGIFYCAAPCNNWVDHGFYQISPTLKFDYFHDNGFEFGISAASVINRDTGLRRRIPLYPGEAGALNFIPARVGHSLQVKKLPGSTYDKVPTQSLYLDKHIGGRRKFAFRPSEPMVSEGKSKFSPVPMERFDIAAATIEQRDGHYVVPFLNQKYPGSVDGRPFRSTALMYEGGRLMPWLVSSPDMVDDRPGAFVHRQNVIHFRPLRGDPKQNTYSLAFPVPS